MDNLKSIVENLQPEELALIHQGSAQEVSELLEAKGLEQGQVSNGDALRLIRDSMAALSDDDLLTISGGEIGKVLGITVATVTASVVAGAVAGTAIGIDAAVR
jgi:hypothetical protein